MSTCNKTYHFLCYQPMWCVHVLQHKWRDGAWRAAWQVPSLHPTRLGWSCPPQDSALSWLDAHPPVAIIWLRIGTWTGTRPSHYQGSLAVLEPQMHVKYRSLRCLDNTLRQVISWKYVTFETPRWFCCKYVMARLHTWLCWHLLTLVITHSVSIL